ncbi:putative RNA-directed DNA polymerase [Tanacetum coccineum]
MVDDFTVDYPLPLAMKLTGYVDGSIPMSSFTITSCESTSPNPAYCSWVVVDQRTLILFQSSLSEEAMAETLGNSTSHSFLSALKAIYCHDYVEQMHTLRDYLRNLQRGSSNMVEFARKCKAICDQLTAIDHPLDETDKSHWFLCGLAESHETFLQSVIGTTVASVAFVTTFTHCSLSHNVTRGCGGHTQYHGGSKQSGNRRPPHC